MAGAGAGAGSVWATGCLQPCQGGGAGGGGDGGEFQVDGRGIPGARTRESARYLLARLCSAAAPDPTADRGWARPRERLSLAHCAAARPAKESVLARPVTAQSTAVAALLFAMSHVSRLHGMGYHAMESSTMRSCLFTPARPLAAKLRTCTQSTRFPAPLSARNCARRTLVGSTGCVWWWADSRMMWKAPTRFSFSALALPCSSLSVRTKRVTHNLAE
jgi:hypothetical protein